MVRARRRSDADGADGGVSEHAVIVVDGGDAWIAGREPSGLLGVELAERQKLELRPLEQVAHDVGTPVAEADDHDPDPRGGVANHAAPRAKSTAGIVRSRIFRLSHSERLSAYSTSRSTICS